MEPRIRLLEEQVRTLTAQLAELQAWKTAEERTAIKFLSPGTIALAQAYTKSMVVTVGGQTAEIAILR